MVQRKLQSTKPVQLFLVQKVKDLEYIDRKCLSTYNEPSPIDSKEVSIGDSNAQTVDTCTILTTPAKRTFTDGKKLCLNNFKTNIT